VCGAQRMRCVYWFRTNLEFRCVYSTKGSRCVRLYLRSLVRTKSKIEVGSSSAAKLTGPARLYTPCWELSVVGRRLGLHKKVTFR